MLRFRDKLFIASTTSFLLGLMFGFNGFMVVWDPDINFQLSMKIGAGFLLLSLALGVLHYMLPRSEDSLKKQAP